jgi:hypothetical protein
MSAILQEVAELHQRQMEVVEQEAQQVALATSDAEVRLAGRKLGVHA